MLMILTAGGWKETSLLLIGIIPFLSKSLSFDIYLYGAHRHLEASSAADNMQDTCPATALVAHDPSASPLEWPRRSLDVQLFEPSIAPLAARLSSTVPSILAAELTITSTLFVFASV